MATATERSRARREKNRAWLKERQTPCLFCGTVENIEWHHTNGNDKEFTMAAANNFTKMEKEIDKCWCLCSHCHSQLHRALVMPLPECYS